MPAQWNVPSIQEVEDKMNEPRDLVPLNERGLAKVFLLFRKHDPKKNIEELFEYHHNAEFRNEVQRLIETDSNILEEENRQDAIELLQKACSDLGANPHFYKTILENFGLN
jgi:hypothetical protein